MSHSTRTRISRERAAASERPASSHSSSTLTATSTRRASSRQPLELRLARQVVRDQDVVDPGVGHHLRLAELLAGDAARAEGHLPARDLDGLVRLDVRAVREPDGVAVRLPPREVAIQPIDVDDEGRRVDLDHEAAPERCATASISTRIPPGNPACTVVRTGYGSAKACAVDLVESVEVGQVDEEDVHLDDVVERAAGGEEARLEVRERLPRLLGDATGDEGAARVEADLAGGVDVVAAANHRGVRRLRADEAVREQRVASHLVSFFRVTVRLPV